MSVTKKGKYYHTRFTVTNKATNSTVRVQESTRETNREQAIKYEEKRRSEIREQLVYGKTLEKMWLEAEKRWLNEMQHKRTIAQDIEKFQYIQPFFQDLTLNQITRDVIENLSLKKEETGAAASTVNRMLALIKAVLNKAYKQWDWLDKVPYIRMRKENNSRIRWLTHEEAQKLIFELPIHLKLVVQFSLATGLRHTNVVNLKWEDIHGNLMLIAGENFKNGKNFSIPLNTEAINILAKCKGFHPVYVFAYNRTRIRCANTKAFRDALKRAGIKDFRWHDLRHTWASWHVQKGTSLQELQLLGGWQTFEMMLRYSHLNKNNLFEAANKIAEIS